MILRPADTVYAVYYSHIHKMELFRKYTVVSVGRKYIIVRDFFDPNGIHRRFHLGTRRSVREQPALEELIEPGPRLDRARAAGALVATYGSIDRMLRDARRTMYDRNKLRTLREVVVTAEVAAEAYVQACAEAART